MTTDFKFSSNSLARLKSVHPKLQAVAIRALELSLVDFGIPPYGGLRTIEEQQELYENGKTQCDGIKDRSLHQDGRAIDVFAFVDGRASWAHEHLNHIAAAMLQAACEQNVKLHWGGFWLSFRDLPHFELVPDVPR